MLCYTNLFEYVQHFKKGGVNVAYDFKPQYLKSRQVDVTAVKYSL